MGQGALIISHSDTFQVYRGQRCNDHIVTLFYIMTIKTTELLKAFIQDV